MQEREEYQLSRRAVTIVVVLLVIAVGAFAYYCYRFVERHAVVPEAATTTTATPIPTPQPPEVFVPSEPEPISTPIAATSQYRCDGRTRCSQMTSCNEATFFLRNCPGTQMDGDNDGIPCEQQWCGN